MWQIVVLNLWRVLTFLKKRAIVSFLAKYVFLEMNPGGYSTQS